MGITGPADRQWVMTRMTPRPLATLQQPACFGHPPPPIVPCTYTACQWALETYRTEPPQAEGMRHVELPTAHPAMLTAPRELADVLPALG